MSEDEAGQVISLHSRLHHAASPAAMAHALRSGAWPSLVLDPTAVEHVFHARNCIACMLGKSNRLPRSLGSGVSPAPFSMCSVDYKPINPAAIGGHTGFYFFVERCYIYKYVVFLKDPPNAISFFNSVKQMYAYFSSF